MDKDKENENVPDNEKLIQRKVYGNVDLDQHGNTRADTTVFVSPSRMSLNENVVTIKQEKLLSPESIMVDAVVVTPG